MEHSRIFVLTSLELVGNFNRIVLSEVGIDHVRFSFLAVNDFQYGCIW